MPRINIYLVRHGETDWNVAGVVQGQKDTTLNETGRTQSMLAGDALRSIRFHFAFTSDLSRARETANIILRDRDPVVELYDEPGLRERFLGNLEGAPPTTDKKKRDELMVNAEPPDDFLARCLKWWDDTIAWLEEGVQRADWKSDVNVLAVSHGAVISTLVYAGLMFTRKLRHGEVARKSIHNTSITVITIDDGGKSGEIRAVSWMEHLMKRGPTDNPDVVENEDEAARQDVQSEAV